MHPTDYYLQKNASGTQFGSYKNTQTDVWLEAAGAAPQPTGINNVKANAKATKAIVNGQIVIVRDNKTYNVFGTCLR